MHKYILMYILACIHRYINMNTHKYTHMYTYVHTHIYICVCVCVHTYTYISIKKGAMSTLIEKKAKEIVRIDGNRLQFRMGRKKTTSYNYKMYI